jgi:hypothetical protein
MTSDNEEHLHMKGAKKSPKAKKKNPLDEVMDELEGYAEGMAPEDLMSSGE